MAKISLVLSGLAIAIVAMVYLSETTLSTKEARAAGKLTTKYYFASYRVMTVTGGAQTPRGLYYGPERVAIIRSTHTRSDYDVPLDKVVDGLYAQDADLAIFEGKRVVGESITIVTGFQPISYIKYDWCEKAGARKIEFTE